MYCCANEVLPVLVNVHMPKDRITQAHQGYGFIEFMGEDDADYAIKIMNMIKLYGKPIRVNKVCLLWSGLCGKHLFVYNADCNNFAKGVVLNFRYK